MTSQKKGLISVQMCPELSLFQATCQILDADLECPDLPLQGSLLTDQALPLLDSSPAGNTVVDNVVFFPVQKWMLDSSKKL